MGGVFANGLEISGKAVSAKTIAAFPDVCMTPPENPATPPGVPVPYPNFAMAGDTEKGTGKVKIKGKTVNLKNKSDMSKTSGDEAGCAAKKGVVSSKNTGKSYFNSWSNNVKFEGEAVVRMSDLTTNNHASPVGNAPPWTHIAAINVETGEEACSAENKKGEKACEGYKTLKEACDAADMGLADGETNKSLPSSGVQKLVGGAVTDLKTKPSKVDSSKRQYRVNKTRRDQWERVKANDCLAARRCMLVPFSEGNDECCGKQTPHHMVPKSSFVSTNDSGKLIDGCDGYDEKQAPCICVEGASSTKGSHGMMHNDMKAKIMKKTGSIKNRVTTKIGVSGGGSIDARSLTYAEQRDTAVKSVARVFPNSGCTPDCLKAQLDAYHQSGEDGKPNIEDDTLLKASINSGRSAEEGGNALTAMDAAHAAAK